MLSGRARVIGRAPAMDDLVEKAVASVVYVNTLEAVPGGHAPEGSGSGFCWDSVGDDTFIVTNRHVVSENEDARYAVSFGEKGGYYAAELVGRHPLVDIAVLRAHIVPRPVLLTFRQAVVQLGEEVVAVGNPKNFTMSLSKGIISAVDRENFSGPENQPVRVLQTDATVNRGNSGGPLLGMDGTVVGVNAHGEAEMLPHPARVFEYRGPGNSGRRLPPGPDDAPFDSEAGRPLYVTPTVDLQGVNFAVPADLAHAAAIGIRDGKGDSVAVGRLGVRFDTDYWMGPGAHPVVQALGSGVGVRITEDPQSGSPAARAGLAQGDVIVSVDESPVDHPADIAAWLIKRSSWEREAPLRFLRGHRMFEVAVQGEMISMGGLIADEERAPAFQFPLDGSSSDAAGSKGS